MPIEASGQMGRLIPSKAVRSAGSGLPGLIRKKNPGTGYSGTGSILNSLRKGTLLDPKSGSVSPTPSGASTASTKKAQTLTGTIRKAVAEDLGDSKPISTNSKGSDEGTTVPASYETGGILASIKSGLTTFMPALLVIGAVIVGIVIIKSAGRK